MVDVLKNKTKTMTSAEDNCVLFLDKMEIAAEIEHDHSWNSFWGTVTLPPRNKPGKHALVFMMACFSLRGTPEYTFLEITKIYKIVLQNLL